MGHDVTDQAAGPSASADGSVSAQVVGIDGAALASIAAERIDWRFKGFPVQVEGEKLGELAARRLDLFVAGFVGPILTLDAEALEHNLREMATWCADRDVQLMPHGKTTMAPQLFARQLAAGASGLTAANASQLRVYRAFGVANVQLANELIDPSALQWVAAELDRDPAFRFTCWVDSVAGVRLMTEALLAEPPARPLEVLVELGGVGGRTGTRDAADARKVAEAVAASPVLRLVGVCGYEGALGRHDGRSQLEIVDEYLVSLREVAIELWTGGLFPGVDSVTVTAGGSAFFDRVADLRQESWPAGMTVDVILRSGAYVTHDHGLYQRSTPTARDAEGPRFRPAMLVWSRVSSQPEDGLAFVTMGKRDVAFDQDLPIPLVRRTVDGRTSDLTGAEVIKLNDQHAFMRLAPGSTVDVGDWIGFGLSHPCTVFDKWQLIPVVSGSTIVDFVRTYF